jgi:hypothetical protein
MGSGWPGHSSTRRSIQLAQRHQQVQVEIGQVSDRTRHRVII